ncbi:MAG TPA: GNAT family N-acetyltransferase [Cyclobacteriaceae bacterium]
MVIDIRKAKPEDFESVYQFVCELQTRVFDKAILKRLYLENILKKDNLYLVAVRNELPIGYLSCHIQILLHHAGKVAEIQEMFVLPGFRSHGVGQQLIEEIKRLTKKEGALQLEVTTRAIREKAIAFYQRESFEDSHKKLVYYF